MWRWTNCFTALNPLLVEGRNWHYLMAGKFTGDQFKSFLSLRQVDLVGQNQVSVSELTKLGDLRSTSPRASTVPAAFTRDASMIWRIRCASSRRLVFRPLPAGCLAALVCLQLAHRCR